MAKLVKMTRADGKTADVHPDEVGNYAKAGYVAPKKPAPKAKK